MITQFNTASLSRLSKSQLYALMAQYRAALDVAGQSERPAIQAAIAAVRSYLAHCEGPK